jgi:hypothetical protein
MDLLITSVLEPKLSLEQAAADVIVQRRGSCLLVIFHSDKGREWLRELITVEELTSPCLILVEEGDPIVEEMRDDQLLVVEITSADCCSPIGSKASKTR